MHVKEGKPLYITPRPDDNKQGWEQFIETIEKEGDLKYTLGRYDEAIKTYDGIIECAGILYRRRFDATNRTCSLQG